MGSHTGKTRKQSISTKIILFVMAMVFITIVLISTVSIVAHRNEVISLKTEQATIVGSLVASYVDGDQLGQLANSDTKTAYYKELKKVLAQIKTASHVKYLYTVVPDPAAKQVRYIAEGQAPDDDPADIYTFNYLVNSSDFFSNDTQFNAFEKAFEDGQIFDNGIYVDPTYGHLLTVFVPVLDSNDKTVAMVGVDLSADAVLAQANQLMFLLFGIALLGLLAMFFVAKAVIKRSVVNPLKKLVLASDSLATGDVNTEVEVTSNDEIGQMAASFQAMIAHIREQANAAQKIAAGDLSIEITPKSEKDVLSRSLKSVIQELGKLSDEVSMLTGTAVNGQLDVRGDINDFNGGYRDIVSGINATLDALIGPLKMSADYMDRISKGDIPPAITDEYYGDFDKIKNNINTCIGAIDALVEDMNSLSISAIEGQLSTRADADRHSGDFAKVVHGVNATLDAVVEPLRVAASYIEQIGRGEIPAKITDTYNGDFNEIKNDINSCIDGLGGLVEGKSVLIKMALNDFAVQVEGSYQGIFKDIADSMNQVCRRVDRTVNVVEHAANGDLSDLEGLQKMGARCPEDRLIPTLLQMIQTISDLVEETKSLSENAVNGNLSARGDAHKFKGEYAKVVLGVNKTLDAVIAPIEEASSVLQEMAKGNLHAKMEGDYQGDHADLKHALNETIDSLVSYVEEISDVLTEIGEGNLQQSITADYKGDFVAIKNALNNIMDSLSDVLSDINQASDQVASGSRQVSDGSQVLSQGATEQASSIQELTASIEEIASQTKQNAVNANQANELATAVKSNAEKGDAHMKEMLDSMVGISDSSVNISKIIKVIDDIAFQTNILALNAAVEAARAGQHGKGFAVVAEEVRNLAARSANAAKETTDLIEGSISKVQSGTKIAENTATALSEIVGGVEKVADLVGSIARASNEQASGIAQVNQGIEQVSQVVQNNSATAEQSAAASEELSSQAELLKEMVARFTLKEGEKKALTGGHKMISAPTKERSAEAPRILMDDSEFDKY